jgi:hypothetical protein
MRAGALQGNVGLGPSEPRALSNSTFEPALIRCRIMDRSNSAKAPATWNTRFPVGVVVSMARSINPTCSRAEGVGAAPIGPTVATLQVGQLCCARPILESVDSTFDFAEASWRQRRSLRAGGISDQIRTPGRAKLLRCRERLGHARAQRGILS